MGGRWRKRLVLAVMRLADAELMPFDFDDFTDTIRRYVSEVEALATSKRNEISARNKAIDDGVFAATDDPRRKMQAPPKETVPPFLNFAPLQNGVAALERVTQAYDKAFAQASENGASALARANLREVNQKLLAIERALTLNDGLPNRPWFRTRFTRRDSTRDTA